MIKRRFIPLMLCAVMAVCTGCGEKDPADVKQTALIGRWTNDTIGGDVCFGSDGQFTLEVDVSSIMTIDGDGIAHLPDSDTDYSKCCSYDGRVFSFNIDGTDMLTMERRGILESDGTENYSVNNAYGFYVMKSGILYDQFAQQGDSADGQYYITAKPGEMIVNVPICDFVCDKDTVILSGDGFSAFMGNGNTENASYSYTVSDGKLVLKNDDETIVFDKIFRE